ncbi:MAG TPA: aminoglycoside phosphotransferase family protein [Solirubrobacteraceae bacterium]|nr:aminoglycoside phosphotransferase family protein [Solirubrobacteraceae bacterium]
MVLFGVLERTGEAVAVKIERIAGSLEVERRALRWLTGQRGPAPRLIAASIAPCRDAACLVTARADGAAPTTTAGWERMGHALARLIDIPHDGCDLTALDPATFGDRHVQRIGELGALLDVLAETVEEWTALCSPTIPGADELVITHGDPGPGNYLDDNATGTLLDWEDAHIAPLGLDLARAAFIALLGAGPAGYLARDHQQRARAVARGYLAQVGERWRPTHEELRWWLAAAGVQFVHRRWQRAGQPGVAPWTDAVDTLRAALTASTNPWR